MSILNYPSEEAENKIKEAYNIINKSSSVAILCKNECDFPMVFASENSEKLFGYTSDELLSGQIKIYNLVHQEDIGFIRNHLFKLLKSKVEIEPKPKAFRIITKSGEIKWIETSIDIIKNKKNNIIPFPKKFKPRAQNTSYESSVEHYDFEEWEADYWMLEKKEYKFLTNSFFHLKIALRLHMLDG